MVYIDNAIKDIFKSLEAKGELENTIIAITADHGYSFANDPIRESFVNNFYLENYHIPFIVYDKGTEPKKITKLHSSKEIPSTLLDICDINENSVFEGKSIFEDNNEEIIWMEYMGGGCPDISRRPIRYAVMNQDNIIVVSVKSDEDITLDKVVEIYNLNKDPMQLNNLIRNKSFDKNEIQTLLDKISLRHKEIQSDRVSVSEESIYDPMYF